MDASNLLSKRAELTPNRVALREMAAGKSYTFAQLNERANRAANFLRHKLGVQKGDVVSLLAHNSVVYIDLLYAATKIGAIFAPLNWRLVAEELVYIVQDCGSKVLICGPEFSQTLAEMLPQIDVAHLVSVEGAQIAGAWIYEDELAAAAENEPERPSLTPEDTACILYTSGTTGKPKGAMIPHRQIVWNAINTVISWGLTQDDISPVFTPMFHSGGLFVFLTPLFYVGGRIVLQRQFDPVETLRVAAAEKCTVLLGVPTIFQMWLNTPELAQTDFSHIRWFISGGAPCPLSLIKGWREATGKPFRQGYGLTEVGTNCFSMNDEDPVTKPGTVGKPIFHSEMKLVDENGRIVSPNQTGELLIKGPHVTSGYWRNPDATAEALRDGWFHTGDMARQDEDGYFYIAGRFKDMIISGGENVYAAEVESVFVAHAAVADAALIGQPDEKWGEVGVMVVLLANGRTVSEAELLAHCQGKLARYKIPKRIIFTDSLPYSPYGKVIKAQLKELLN
ncbi:MAG: long-chain fatty acid--CoA ligase [Ardenticatenaceae bacterium]|nr:long-chain fatty acid--CoA ligase [Ardenticatenaceae bacterium]